MGASSSTRWPRWKTSFGSSVPAAPSSNASTHEACQSSRIASLSEAAAKTDTIEVTYCSYIRTGRGSPLSFSNVIPAAWNATVGTVSP